MTVHARHNVTMYLIDHRRTNGPNQIFSSKFCLKVGNVANSTISTSMTSVLFHICNNLDHPVTPQLVQTYVHVHQGNIS